MVSIGLLFVLNSFLKAIYYRLLAVRKYFFTIVQFTHRMQLIC